MRGKDYTKATVAADAGQAQQLADGSCFSEDWEAGERRQAQRRKLHVSRSMVTFLILDLIAITIASFASIWIRY